MLVAVGNSVIFELGLNVYIHLRWSTIQGKDQYFRYHEWPSGESLKVLLLLLLLSVH